MSNPLPSEDETARCAPTPLIGNVLSAGPAAGLALRFKALADPVRLRLLSQIAAHVDGEACVCDISAGLDVSQPTISHHLKVLRHAGLLVSERRGSWVYYRVLPDVFTELADLLTTVGGAATTLAR